MEQILKKELIETAMQRLRNFELSFGTLKSYKTRAFHQIRHFSVAGIQITMMSF